jgi:hypothetical protein
MPSPASHLTPVRLRARQLHRLFALLVALAVALAVVVVVVALPARAATIPDIIGVPGSALAHPGIGIGKQDLERLRAHVGAHDEPWYSYYQAFSANVYSSKTYVIQNDLNPSSETMTPKYGYVTWPMLAGAVTVNMTLMLIAGWVIFDQVMVLTSGGPGFVSETMAFFIY